MANNNGEKLVAGEKIVYTKEEIRRYNVAMINRYLEKLNDNEVEKIWFLVRCDENDKKSN